LFFRIPTISIDEAHREDCWRGAKFVESLLLSVGSDARVVQAMPQKNPLVIAKMSLGDPSPGRSPCRIVVYGHYDVQPVVESLWDSPPFALTAVNGYLYGRGASDNKGPITAMILGAKELLLEENLGVEIVFLLDGEEEAGFEGGGFKEAVQANMDLIGDADVALIANTYWIGTERPCLTYGFRGSIHIQLTVHGPSHNLHSGVHGGAFYEPMTDLVHVLSSLQDVHGDVAIPGFYDGVREISESEKKFYDQLVNDFYVEKYMNDLGVKKLRGETSTEVLMNRWRRPTISIHGIHTSYPGKFGTVAAVSKSASAMISFRTVPDQDVEKIVGMVDKFVQEQFVKLGSGNTLSFNVVSHGDWWLGDPSNSYFKAADAAIREHWNVSPLYVREGGTMPTSSFLESTLKSTVIHIPFGQITDQAHLENERIRLLNLIKGKDVFKSFVRNACCQDSELERKD
jgi:di- and tripeptidase